MRWIKKGPPPPGLEEVRRTPGATYSDADVPRLRERLVKDQQGLCCYCMQEIDADSSRLEHLRPRSLHEDEELAWTNMLAACNTEGLAEKYRHCDLTKDGDPISVSPLLKEHMARVHFTHSGRVLSYDPNHQADIDDRLKLNVDCLVKARGHAFKTLVNEKHGGRPSVIARQRLIERCRDPNSRQLTGFAEFLAWKLERMG